MLKYTNFFEDFDIPCYGERNIHNPENVNKLLERIELLKNKNTAETVKRGFIERFGPIADQLKVLNSWLGQIRDENFRTKQAEACFRSQYKRFENLINQFEKKYVYQEDLLKMIQIFKKNTTNLSIKLDIDRALEIMDHIYPYTGKLIAVDIFKEDEDIIDSVFKFQMQYKKLRRQLNGLKLNQNNTIKAIYDYLGVSCVNSPQTVLYKLDMKENSIDEQRHQGNEGQLIDDLREYYDDSIEQIKLFEFMVRIYDLETNEVTFKKYQGKSLPNATHKILNTLMVDQEDPKFIKDYFEYQSLKYDFTYVLSELLKSLSAVAKKTCLFCDFEYNVEDHKNCPKCGYSEDDVQMINQAIMDGFSEIHNKDIKKASVHGELLKDIFKRKGKVASSKTKKSYNGFISAYNRLKKQLSSRRRKVRRVLLTLFLILTAGTVTIYFTKYKPFEKEIIVEDIYLYTQDDFMKIYESNILNDNYYLMNDISFYDDTITPIGTHDNPFRGKFFGNGYTLKNLFVESLQDVTALFNYNQGLIENLNIQNMEVRGKNEIAGFVNINQGEIRNISIQSLSIITMEASRTLTSTFAIKNYGTIENVYVDSTFNLSNPYFLSGFAIVNEGIIKHSFSRVGIVYNEAVEDASAFISKNSDSALLVNNYVSTELTAYSFSLPEGVEFISMLSFDIEKFMTEKLQWSKEFWTIKENHYVVKVVNS